MRGTLPRKAKQAQRLVRFVTARYQTLSLDGGRLGQAYAGVRTTIGAPRFPLKYQLAGAAVGMLPPARLFSALRDGSSWDEYESGYRAHLDKVGVQAIEQELEAIQSRAGRPLALLCFCDIEDGGNCHRRVFASWWQEKTGEMVPELEV